MDSASRREELLNLLTRWNQNALPPATLTTGRDFGGDAFEQWTPIPLTEIMTLSTGLSSSSSSATTVPIYDAERQRSDILTRLRALEQSSGNSAPPGFENVPRLTSPPSLDSIWKSSTRKSDSDGGYSTTENGSSSPYQSRHYWSPSRSGEVMTTSSVAPRQSSMTEQELQALQELSQTGQGRSFGTLGFSHSPREPEAVDEALLSGEVNYLTPQVHATSAYSHMSRQASYPLATGGQGGCQFPAQTPILSIFPERTINFSNCPTRFTVHAIDMPVDVAVGDCTIEGMVITPSGIILPCQMQEMERMSIYEPNLFSGVFSSVGEAGRYKLKVRLIFPFNPQFAIGNHGIISTEAQLLVSRNYYRESTKQYPQSFEVDFVPWHIRGRHRYPESDGVAGHPQNPSKVWGLTCDKLTNRFYCTDRNGHSLTCLDAEGRVIFKIPGSNPLFNRPAGICVDDVHRRLIVADKDGHAIHFLSMDGKHLASVGKRGHGQGEFNYPWDVAASPNGNLIAVTDSLNKRVQLLDYQGKYLNKFSVYEQNPYEYKYNFEYPRGITFSRDGTFVFVTDFNTNNVSEIPLSMTTYRKLLPARKLYGPQGIATDELGNLLVCDSKNGCIRLLHPVSGHFLSTINSVGSERLQFPVNLTLMGDGRLAVLDSQGKIRIF